MIQGVCCREQSCRLWEQLEKPVKSWASAPGVGPEAALGGHEGGGEDRPAPRRTNWSPCLGLTAFRLSDTGDLQEELAPSGVALHLARASEQLQAAWQGLEELR